MGWEQFAAGWAEQHDGYDPRRAPAPVRGWLRAGYLASRAVAGTGVRPATIALVGLVLAAGVPPLAAAGPVGLLTAAALVLLSTFAGTLDGALTVQAGHRSGRAAVRFEVAARITELAWLVAVWLAGAPGLLVVACGAATGLYEYGKGQAHTAGMSRIGAHTVAARPMRVAVAAAGLALAGLVSVVGRPLAAGLLTVAAAIWLLFTGLGLGQLTTAVRHSLR